MPIFENINDFMLGGWIVMRGRRDLLDFEGMHHCHREWMIYDTR